MSTEPTHTNHNSEQRLPATEGVRKLAAIMFTDVKGFSKKMGKDEAATMRMLTMHNQIMRVAVTKYEGNVIKTVGDAFLVSFESVVTAFQCATEAQQKFHDHNTAATTEEEKIVVRIGVHLGDVIVKDKDVFGDGVNIAARIQSLATPGGVCISEDAARALRGKFELPLLKLGRGQLKNVDLPVVIYKAVLPWEKDQLPIKQKIQFVLKQRKTRLLTGSAIAIFLIIVLFLIKIFILQPPLSAADKSIAVLPFVNIGDPENEYLADGITDEITSQLDKLLHLRVISKMSAFKFKGSKESDSTIASELNVRFLLRGDLQVSGSRVKLITSLKDTKTGEKVLERSYDNAKPEIFGTEDNIALTVAEYFDLDYESIKKTTRKVIPEAYEYFLKGLFYFKKERRDDNRLAIESFSDAFKRDSSFAPAVGYLGETKKLEYESGWDQSESILAEAEKNCQQALRLDPNNARVLAVMGDIENLRGNQTEAMNLYQKSLSIDQNNELAMTSLAELYLFNLNELSKAFALLKSLQEINPTSARINSNLGVGYGMLKNYSEAINAFRRALRLNPNDIKSWNNLGYALERIANYDSAIICYRIAQEKDHLETVTYENLVTLLLATKKFSDAESILTVGTKYLPNNHELMYMLGVTYLSGGQRSKALESFQDGYRLLQLKIRKEPNISQYRADEALFHARLGNQPSAIAAANEAYKLDSLDNKITLKIAKVYAILENKSKMLTWFEKAKEKNAEYDVAFLTTAIDFEKYRNDRDLLLIARQQ